MTEPRTLAEQLDATESGEDFLQVLQGLFGALQSIEDDE